MVSPAVRFLTPSRRRSKTKAINIHSSPFKEQKKKQKKILQRIMRRVSSRQRIHSFDDGFCGCDDDDDSLFFLDSTDDRKRKVLHMIPPNERLLQLPKDLLLNALTFCDRDDLRNVLPVHSNLASLLCSDDAKRIVWKPMAIQMFPWMMMNHHDTIEIESPNDILGAEVKDLPSCIDDSLFQNATTGSNESLELVDDHTVQFTGTTGRGDRSIRANLPFPHTNARNSTFLRRTKAKPFLMGMTTTTTTPTIHRIVATRIAYYEVTIGTTATISSHDCVAIGLSTNQFRLHGRQPGWDHWSFGLHGDDGGLFHSDGQMIRKYDTGFQPGDTIGCGIDYDAQTIFYTKNGTFTGTAFTLKDYQMQLSWYPTIGLDTNQPVSCNFGQYAFQYQGFLQL